LQSGTFQHDQPKIADYQADMAHPGTFPNGFTMAKFCADFPATCNDTWWAGLTPYPQVYGGYTGPLLSVGSPLGNADYKSLQFSVTRRAAQGLSLQMSYNWSRTHGDVNSDFQEPWGTGSLQDTYNLKQEAKGISDFDITHIVKGYVIYNLPFGRGKQLFSNVSTLTDAMIGGWSLDGDVHYNTGTPISVHSTNSIPGFNSIYIDLVPGCKLTLGSRKLNKPWLNPACFQNPSANDLGTGGNYQAQVRNPGTATEDLSVHKSLAVGQDKRYNLTLRIEFFNVFNRDALGGPDTGLNDTKKVGSTTINDFGYINGYGGVGGRQGQFGARFTF
jgi:hypothetical protein